MGQQVFHLVGLQGSGKTTLTVAMAHWHARKGSVCMRKDFLGGYSLFDADLGDFYYDGFLNAHDADVLFVEHLPSGFTGAKPGETVIRMEATPEAVQGVWAHEVKELSELKSGQPARQLFSQREPEPWTGLDKSVLTRAAVPFPSPSDDVDTSQLRIVKLRPPYAKQAQYLVIDLALLPAS